MRSILPPDTVSNTVNTTSTAANLAATANIAVAANATNTANVTTNTNVSSVGSANSWLVRPVSWSACTAQIVQPAPGSHKGSNGKTLIIGGSDLFHAASQWSFQVIARWVDMTFYSSVVENNALLHDAKLYGQDGVIVRRSDLPSYLDEVDSILIGPGMRRDVSSRFSADDLAQVRWSDLTSHDWEHDTAAVVAALLHGWPQKKWVIDAGALQILSPSWLSGVSAVLTPHQRELALLAERSSAARHIQHLAQMVADQITMAMAELPRVATGTRSTRLPGQAPRTPASQPAQVWEIKSGDFVARESRQSDLSHVTWLIKGLNGAIDVVISGREVWAVSGGNAGLTKGGTGDVLAGQVAAFVAKSDPRWSAVVASGLVKSAAHRLYRQQATMYHTSDLVGMLPIMWAG